MASPVCKGFALLGFLVLTTAATVATARADAWSEKKCALYADAWSRVVEWRGGNGLGEDFVSGNKRFIDGGCSTPASVCPKSAAEFAVADMLSMMAVSQGITGSFLPFGCKG